MIEFTTHPVVLYGIAILAGMLAAYWLNRLIWSKARRDHKRS